MLNVNTIKNGLVIDHIRAGSGWKIYQWLGLDKAPFTSCLIQNVHSEKTDKKDEVSPLQERQRSDPDAPVGESIPRLD